MFIEAVIIIILIFIVLEVTGSISLNKFVKDNQEYFKTMKESDYEFLLKARYGDGIDSDRLFTMRIRDGAITIVLVIFLFINSLDYTKVIVALVAGYAVFKIIIECNITKTYQSFNISKKLAPPNKNCINITNKYSAKPNVKNLP